DGNYRRTGLGEIRRVAAVGAGGSCLTRQNRQLRETADIFAPQIGAPPKATKTVNVFVSSISCFPAGSLVAARAYTDSSGAFVPMSFTRSAGRWRRATAISLPGNALNGSAQFAPLNSVSCTATGFCTAVGDYHTASAIRAMAVSGSLGLSGRTSEITAA